MTADGPKYGAGINIAARRRGSAASWDAEIAKVAAQQYGLIAIDQLQVLGIDSSTASRRVQVGSLYRVHQGVYAVGRPIEGQEGRFMAAVLACGSGAVLSHRSAAALWGIRAEHRSTTDVTAPRRRGRVPVGIAAHRADFLRTEDCTVLHQIPCTTVARTLLDLAGILPVHELRKAVAEAEVNRVLKLTAVREVIKRGRGRRGVARLRMVIEELDPDTKRTRSELERRFLALCRRAGLPRPEVNVLLDLDDVRFEPDFLWRDQRLIIEADGRQSHDTYSAFESDRRRSQRLQLAGWRVTQCTWSQVIHDPQGLAATIRGLLAIADGPKS